MPRIPLRLAIATGAVLALHGCAPDGSCLNDWCGTVVVVTPAEADVLLPPAGRLDVGIAIGDLVFIRLADVGEDMRTVGDSGFRPQLATAWRYETPTTLVFSLDPDARWHDGAPVTAADVAFTFDVYTDSVIGSQSRSRLERITAVTPRDDHTVVFRFAAPYGEQFFDAVYHMRILPRHLLDTVPRARLAEHPFGRQPIGSGPFRFVSWRAGESVELAADSAFFLGRPGVRRIIWRFAADQTTALTQLVAGEADVLNFLGGPENIQRARAAGDVRIVETQSSVYGYIAYNFRDSGRSNLPHPLFSDARVRRALTMALDRHAIVTALFGAQGLVPPGPVPPALWIWDDSLPQLPFDTAAARALLADAGWRDSDGDGVLDRGGRRLAFELILPTSSGLRRQAAVLAQEQWRRLGAEVEVGALEVNTFGERARSGRFDAAFGAYGGDPSPALIAEVWSEEAIGGFNWGRYRNTETTGLMRTAMAARTPEEVSAGWRAVAARLVEDAPAIWMYAPVMTAGVHARFEPAPIRPDQWAAELWLWRVDPARRLARDLIVH
jgi:peptide/nickel transport system substrate-binding protein